MTTAEYTSTELWSVRQQRNALNAILLRKDVEIRELRDQLKRLIQQQEKAL